VAPPDWREEGDRAKENREWEVCRRVQRKVGSRRDPSSSAAAGGNFSSVDGVSSPETRKSENLSFSHSSKVSPTVVLRSSLRRNQFFFFTPRKEKILLNEKKACGINPEK
jgi:hypothetical protein